MPADAGLDQQVVFGGAVAAHLGERHAKTVGTNARRLVQYFAEIFFTKGERAKFRQRRLLAQQFFGGAGIVASRHNTCS
jgi:hypothetical protein